jgi:hypothetical protein
MPSNLLTSHHLEKAPRDQWPATTAVRAMLPLEQSVQPNTDLWATLEEIGWDVILSRTLLHK